MNELNEQSNAKNFLFPNNGIYFALYYAKTLSIWRIQTWGNCKIISDDWILSVKFSPHDKYVALSCKIKVSVWDIELRELPIYAYFDTVNANAFSYDERLFAFVFSKLFVFNFEFLCSLLLLDQNQQEQKYANEL